MAWLEGAVVVMLMSRLLERLTNREPETSSGHCGGFTGTQCRACSAALWRTQYVPEVATTEISQR